MSGGAQQSCALACAYPIDPSSSQLGNSLCLATRYQANEGACFVLRLQLPRLCVFASRATPRCSFFAFTPKRVLYARWCRPPEGALSCISCGTPRSGDSSASLLSRATKMSWVCVAPPGARRLPNLPPEHHPAPEGAHYRRRRLRRGCGGVGSDGHRPLPRGGAGHALGGGSRRVRARQRQGVAHDAEIGALVEPSEGGEEGPGIGGRSASPKEDPGGTVITVLIFGRFHEDLGFPLICL